MNTFIRLLYAVLIAAAVVTFVSVGIYTFYPSPTAPDYPQITAPAQKDGAVNGPSAEAQRSYDLKFKQYQSDSQLYNRNVSLIGTALAAIIVLGGLYVRRRSSVIGEGIALGGIGVSIYGIATAVMANDRVMRFLAVSVFLAAAIIIVYVQFSDKKPAKAVARKTK